MSNMRFTVTALLAAVSLIPTCLFAEVPPLPKERLADEATLVLTGKVTAVESQVVREEPSGFKEVRCTLTIEPTAVSKGELKDRAKPITVVGARNVLAPRTTGSTGHRSNNTVHKISDVGRGWELRLYLAPGENGAYNIVFPNGFEVLKEAKDPTTVPATRPAK
jgi:hypothetical protein